MSEQSQGQEQNQQGRAQGGNATADTRPRSSNVSYRIDGPSMVSILFLAGFFDILSFIPVFNVIVTPVAQGFIFPFVFFLHGVSVVGPKNWIWYLLAWVVEIIPFVSMFPTITLMALRIIAISQVEDRLGALNLVANSSRAKAIARLGLQKGKQLIAQQEKRAVAASARRRGGGYDRDKIKEKRGKIADRRADLNKSLSGVKSATLGGNINYLTGANARADKRQKSAQSDFSGVQTPDSETE